MIIKNIYCLFCKKDTESKVAHIINSHSIKGDTVAIAPTKIITEKRQGKWCEKLVSLIPNYVFVYSNEIIEIGNYAKSSGAYRSLQYSD